MSEIIVVNGKVVTPSKKVTLDKVGVKKNLNDVIKDALSKKK